MLILPVNHICDLENPFPLNPSQFEENVEKICQLSKMILINHWLPECADIFLEFKTHWRQYVPKKPTPCCDTVEKFFCCVNMLLSMQMRSLVVRSLMHFKQLLVTFKVCRCNIIIIYIHEISFGSR